MVLAAPACAGEGDCPPGYQRAGQGCRRPSTGGGAVAAEALCESAVVINEVLYDPEGNEGQGKAFVELAGPVGAPLDGWMLERIGSNGEADGAALVLAGGIADEGYFLVGESGMVQGDVEPDLVDPRVDGKNTNYAFRLVCQGVVVDAVAYGAWEEEDGPRRPRTAPKGRPGQLC